MIITDIISKKCKKKELSAGELEFFIKGVSDGSLPDYQISALLMAIFLNGMTERETSDLTLLMANSGDVLDLSSFGEITVDKHSTGGVGDKTTLVCGPVAAAMGCKVAKMSGRGLGFTGGTVDKLESINGYKTALSVEEFLQNTEKIGLCLVGQSGDFAPADKRLYALRDVTATVESIPLIASSIMSKKIAAGARNILLDVKYGSGAFMKTPEDAEKLARAMVKIGNSLGRNTAAVITDMDTPLGNNIGNALEVKEACEILKGKGDKRLCSLCLSLSAYMYSLTFKTSYESALELAKETISCGKAFEKLLQAVSAQGGDIKLLTGERAFDEPQAEFLLKAERSGYISEIDSEIVGKSALLSGAGRKKKDDTIDPTAGIVLNKHYGDYVEKGEPLARVYGKKEKAEEASRLLSSAYKITDNKPKAKEIIYKIIGEF